MAHQVCQLVGWTKGELSDAMPNVDFANTIFATPSVNPTPLVASAASDTESDLPIVNTQNTQSRQHLVETLIPC